ncbi:MAG TPA: serine/threonine-protein kinase [Gemmatales bacterium]|nr:serine/threonine-protein kinase [Gemmatales bacterium]
MLGAHAKAQTPIPLGPTEIENPGPDRGQPQEQAYAPGTILDGRYRLIDLIAVGGMGAVYRACRVSDMRMEVAIKLVKPGMNSQQVLARFNIERQALAMMKHENIAKVLDAGTTQDGSPYFVMELVKGLSITRFCDENTLNVHQRLQLFEQICSAVHHAHQKGIVHRDLKPSNILVGLYDDKAVPKVIDFGLAKALHQPITEDVLHTKFGAFVGTWQYTAPEQAILNNLDIDIRADIYSLGVILYELLTGNPPIEKSRITHAVMEEVLRIIREEEPLKPSTKIHSSNQLPSIAAMRGSEPLQLERQIRGELDWIVMKALEKDRNRRFASANEFGQEIHRYLHGEPVQTMPVSWQYKFRKFIYKHRGKVLAASLLFASLLMGAIVSAMGWIQATREKTRADQNAAIAMAVNQFLCDDLLAQADPSVQIRPGQTFISDMKVLEALDRAADKVGKRFSDQPLVEAAIRMTLGKTYLGLGDIEKAKVQMNQAEDIYRSNKRDTSPERLSALHENGSILLYQGKYQEAEKIVANVIKLRQLTLGKQHHETLKSQYLLALIYSYLNRRSESKHMYESVLQEQKSLYGLENYDTQLTQREYADLLVESNEVDKAILLLKEVLNKQIESLGTDHPDTLITQHNLVMAYLLKDQIKDATILLHNVITNASKYMKRQHPVLLSYKTNYASLLAAEARYQEASDSLKQVVDDMKVVYGPMHYDTLSAQRLRGACLLMSKKYDAAEQLLQETVHGLNKTLGIRDANTRQATRELLRLYLLIMWRYPTNQTNSCLYWC